MLYSPAAEAVAVPLWLLSLNFCQKYEALQALHSPEFIQEEPVLPTALHDYVGPHVGI